LVGGPAPGEEAGAIENNTGRSSTQPTSTSRAANRSVAKRSVVKRGSNRIARVIVVCFALVCASNSPLGSVAQVGPLNVAAENVKSNTPKSNSAADVRPGASALPKAAATPGTTSSDSLPRPVPLPMKPAIVPLDPNLDAQFVGSDGRLEIDLPAGAISATDLGAAGGSLSLSIRQIAPASGSTAGASGRYSFGTYLVQTITATKTEWLTALRKSPTFRLHVSQQERAFNLSKVQLVFNGALPADTNFNPDPSGATVLAAQANLGAASAFRATFDNASQTLSATAAMPVDPAVSFDTNSPVASFGKPDPFTADLSAGGLSSSYPIDVPAGPGGLTPPINLTYSSAGLNEQHNPQAAANWVGEGWNLSMGSISWAEHNVAASTPTPNWRDSWMLNDPYGTSTELIPPSTTTSTYFQDNGNPISASPITWHTADESHAKVISYTVPVLNSDTAATSPSAGTVETFTRATDGAIYRRTYSNGSWGSWSNLGGNSLSAPAASSLLGNARFDLFERGTDNAVYHKWWHLLEWLGIAWWECHGQASRCATGEQQDRCLCRRY
jgi:hypothetical protein